ncbi:MAG: hypothetical protein HC888_02200 [Candidatus Competibacteraceae bacterium]|nr:hypothetical protein [Candidatus Competibacteraceae bacterium]
MLGKVVRAFADAVVGYPPQLPELLRMPLISKSNFPARLSEYDIIFPMSELAKNELVLPLDPFKPFPHGVNALVLIPSTYKGSPCAMRLEPLNAALLQGKKDPLIETDLIERNIEWGHFIRGARKAERYKYGPRIYGVFKMSTGLIPMSKPTDKANIKREIIFGCNAVEKMDMTFWEYCMVKGQNHLFHKRPNLDLNMDDFLQFVTLFTNMKEAYAGNLSGFPYDLHAANAMMKMVDGKRVWLFTDVDEKYMQEEKQTPQQLAERLFRKIGIEPYKLPLAPAAPAPAAPAPAAPAPAAPKKPVAKRAAPPPGAAPQRPAPAPRLAKPPPPKVLPLDPGSIPMTPPLARRGAAAEPCGRAECRYSCCPIRGKADCKGCRWCCLSKPRSNTTPHSKSGWCKDGTA